MTGLANMIGGRQDGRWRIVVWAVIATILAIPLVAMRFTDEVAWDAADFGFMAVLLVGAALLFEPAVWKVRRPLHRVVIGLGVVAVALLIWAEAAVGILS